MAVSVCSSPWRKTLGLVFLSIMPYQFCFPLVHSWGLTLSTYSRNDLRSLHILLDTLNSSETLRLGSGLPKTIHSLSNPGQCWASRSGAWTKGIRKQSWDLGYVSKSPQFHQLCIRAKAVWNGLKLDFLQEPDLKIRFSRKQQHSTAKQSRILAADSSKVLTNRGE